MKVLFIFAHPDDESFATGGTIVRLAKSDWKVKLITATKGEKGQLGDPPFSVKENLGKTREKELKNAAKILGIETIQFLGFIDAALKDHVVDLKQRILAILIKEAPDVVITFDRYGGSNHPDHKAVSIATTKSFKKYMSTSKKHVRLYHTAVPRSYLKRYEKTGLSYNAFGKMKGTLDSDITTIVDIKNTYPLKVQALLCHKTQKKDVDRFLKRGPFVNLKKEFFELIYENGIEGY